MFIGIRYPAHPIALELLRACNLPIAAPSANRFAHVSPTRAYHVLHDLGEKGVYVINGESSLSDINDKSTIEKPNIQSCQYGIESTVLKINQETNTLLIYRLGAITKTDLEQCLKAYGQGLEFWTIEITSRQVSLPTIKPNKNNHPPQKNNINDIISNHDTIIDNNNLNDQKLKVSHVEDTTLGEVAPGQAITHYSPDVPCYIINNIQHNNNHTTSNIQNDSNSHTNNINNNNSMTNTIFNATNNSSSNSSSSNHEIKYITKENLKNTVIIDFHGQLQSLKTYALAYRDLSPTGNVKEAARHLFDYLRWSENIPLALEIYLPTMTLHNTNKIQNSGNQQQQTKPLENSSSIQISENNYNNNNNNNNNNEFIDGVADRINRAASGKSIKLIVSL